MTWFLFFSINFISLITLVFLFGESSKNFPTSGGFSGSAGAASSFWDDSSSQDHGFPWEVNFLFLIRACTVSSAERFLVWGCFFLGLVLLGTLIIFLNFSLNLTTFFGFFFLPFETFCFLFSVGVALLGTLVIFLNFSLNLTTFFGFSSFFVFSFRSLCFEDPHSPCVSRSNSCLGTR